MKSDVLPIMLKPNTRMLNRLDQIHQNKINFKSHVSRQCFVVFFSFFLLNSDGIIHEEFMQESSTINPQYYLGIIGQLVKRIQQVLSQM